MPMSCSICGHRKRQEIDRALLEKRPLRHTAAQFSTSTGALQRHRAHIHRDLVEAHQTAARVEQFACADSLLADVRTAEGRAERLLEVAEDILEKAREAEDLKTAIGAIRAPRTRWLNGGNSWSFVGSLRASCLTWRTRRPMSP